jgi:hypothetical protein
MVIFQKIPVWNIAYDVFNHRQTISFTFDRDHVVQENRVLSEDICNVPYRSE